MSLFASIHLNMNKIIYTQVSKEAHIQQILELQEKNLTTNISKEEAQAQGFVTVKHDAQILREMNDPHPHTIAMDENKVVGFALTMTKDFRKRIPVLEPMFDLIDSLSYNGERLKETRYFTMGQVCIDKDYRGIGIFKNLYETMKTSYHMHFDYLITEIAARNTRSMRAHAKVGFEEIKRYKEGDVTWVMVIWKF